MSKTSDSPLVAYNLDDTELALGFRVRDYKTARDASPPDRHAIAKAIRSRFQNRYIDPVRAKPRGFTIMAVSCLMIEALESFLQGWESSDGQSKASFCFFFDEFDEFKDFRGHAQQFYKHVRCGILHQAETTGGWRIRKDPGSPLLSSAGRTINAVKFLKALEIVLHRFCDDLEELSWDSVEWKNVRKKMNAIIRNCNTAG